MMPAFFLILLAGAALSPVVAFFASDLRWLLITVVCLCGIALR